MESKQRISKMAEVKGGGKRLLTIALDVSLTDDGRFSASGYYKFAEAEGGGQCLDAMRNVLHRAGLVCPKLEAVMEYWPRYHLNDMVAGSPRQMEVVRERIAQKLPTDYDTMCEVLSREGIFEDKEYPYNGRGYRYGEAWLKEEIPQEELDGIKAAISMPLTLEKAA